MKSLFTDMSQKLRFIFFLAGAWGLVTSPNMCTARSISGHSSAHIGGHAGGHMGGHIGSHASHLSGSHGLGKGEHMRVDHVHNNSEHRFDRGRGEEHGHGLDRGHAEQHGHGLDRGHAEQHGHGLDRGHTEEHFRHDEMARRDNWNGHKDRQFDHRAKVEETRRDEHNHYLGATHHRRDDRNAEHIDDHREPNRNLGINERPSNSINNPNTHAGNYFKVDKP